MSSKAVRTPTKFSTTHNHHLTPRSRQGENGKGNLLRLRNDRHFYWHQLFRKANGTERTLEEVIALLLRVHRAKGRCTKKLTSYCALEVRYGHRRTHSHFHPALVSKQRVGLSRVH